MEAETDQIQQMKWTADNDRKLLLVGLGREISPKEYAAIASLFPGTFKPPFHLYSLVELNSFADHARVMV